MMKNTRAAEMKHAETGLLGFYIYLHGKMQQHHLHKQQQKHLEHLAPEIGFSSSGIPKKIELFGDYVARQIGLRKGGAVARRLGEAAMAYVSGDKSNSDHSIEGILAFLSKVSAEALDDKEMIDLSDELVKELDACMISYFAFHWDHSTHLLDQVRDGERKLKSILWAATRKHRFQKITATFKTKRAFSTLVETMKAMKPDRSGVPREGDVVVPADSSVRSPVLLLIGGGMGAGKSTVVKEILSSSFWSAVVHDAVVVEADAFKETDVIYRTISSSSHGDGGDIALASQLVHSNSTQAASSLLVSALNEGRDVIFDGTMMWEPFVRQTIEMARDVHRRRYRLGRGYVKAEDGSEVEEYWVPFDDDEEEEDSQQKKNKKPYRIELVGVTCDPLLAVVRGIRRTIITKRAVPIKGQLRSHRLFAASLEKYCELVDQAQIFSTSRIGEPAELIGWKDGSLSNRSKLLVDPKEFQVVQELAKLNENAGNVFQLYEDSHECGVWKEVVLNPGRKVRQEHLRKVLSAGDGDFGGDLSTSSVSSESSLHHSSDVSSVS